MKVLLDFRGEIPAFLSRGVPRPSGWKFECAEREEKVPDHPGAHVRLEARQDRWLQHCELLKPHRIDHRHLQTAIPEEPRLASTSHLFTHHVRPDTVNDDGRQANTQPKPLEGRLHSFIEAGKP